MVTVWEVALHNLDQSYPSRNLKKSLSVFVQTQTHVILSGQDYQIVFRQMVRFITGMSMKLKLLLEMKDADVVLSFAAHLCRGCEHNMNTLLQ